ncbi:MAG: U32 family peptidase, partial [Deltaproteobacteria bacterium]|nr:U32 family peptidase [Deltaproteobacteria bacterium]
RRVAGNFDWDGLEWALRLARDLGRRIYVTVNVLAFEEDLARLVPVLRRLEDLRPHGVVVADPGVLALGRREAPHLRWHLSTQASVTNREAAAFWAAAGVARIVVARELSLGQLAGVVRGAPCEVEAFCHGAVCVAWSGRCLLSLYWAGRDPRIGDCAQACRWPWRDLEDRRRPGEANRVEEDDRGTYFFDAKDLCTIPLLPALLETGIRALKIEGRTRSEHYVGVVVDVYRDALRLLAEGDRAGFEARREAWVEELGRPTGRGFSTHFLGGEQGSPSSYNPGGSFRGGDRNEFLGLVTATRPDGLVVRLRNALRPGDALDVRDAGLRCENVTVTRIQRPDGTTDGLGRAGEDVLLPGVFRAGIGALVRRRGLASAGPLP